MASLLRPALLWLLAVGSSRALLTANVAADGGPSVTFAVGDHILEVAYKRSQIGPLGREAQQLLLSDQGSLQVNLTEISPDVFEVDVIAPAGAAESTVREITLTFAIAETFYGVWEYPWNGSIISNGVAYPTHGVSGWVKGVNWANARAPFFFQRTGFGLYFDTASLGFFDFTIPNTVRFGFDGGIPKQYIFFDPDPKGILRKFADLTDKPEMPPDAGYGPTFWSDDFEQDFHEGVTNAEENYYDVVNHLYANRIRATGMVADRPFGTGTNGWGNFDFDPAFYPNASRLIRNLSDWGFEVQAWVGNRAYLHTELYNVSLANRWFFPEIDPATFDGPALNLSIPEAYAYFLERMSFFPQLGIKGYKIDRGEEGEMPIWEQNQQMVLFTQLCYDSMEAVWGAGNFYNYARSAYDRSRARTHVWNGDAYATWDGLTYTVASGIRAGLLGFAQWGSDTGGYLRLKDEEPVEELWARWMHVSAFSPMYEILVGRGRTPWYKPYTERLVRVLADTAETHTRLIPYIRSHIYQATLTGIPVVRALFLEFPSDESVWETNDAYAFGSELFVAPVVAPGGSRTVYFPQGGGRFLEYFNKTAVHEPGTTVNLSDLPLEDCPVYVREGAILPTGDVLQGNAKWVANWKPHLVIEVYPSWGVEESTFVYYKGKEAGKTEGGAVVITMRTNKAKREVVVSSNDDFGIDTRVLVYGRDTMHNLTMQSNRERKLVRTEGFVSLFGDDEKGAELIVDL